MQVTGAKAVRKSKCEPLNLYQKIYVHGLVKARKAESTRGAQSESRSTRGVAKAAKVEVFAAASRPRGGGGPIDKGCKGIGTRCQAKVIKEVTKSLQKGCKPLM